MSESASLATANLSHESVQLTRTQHTWTGAGSAAGYVLRYLAPVRKLMIEMVGDAEDADRAIVILITHLVKSGFAEHGQGRLRDFLLKGIRSSLKARLDEREKQGDASSKDVNWQLATPENSVWLQMWRETLMQRAWRSLERHQYASRCVFAEQNEMSESSPETSNSVDEQGPSSADDSSGRLSDEVSVEEQVIYDCLHVAMAHPGESAEVLAGRVAKSTGRTCTPNELKKQMGIGRLRFAQLLADEVAQSLDPVDVNTVRDEIKKLELQKAFAGLKVRA